MKILIAGDFCARDIENTLSAAMFADIKEFTDEYDIRRGQCGKRIDRPPGCPYLRTVPL